MMKYIIELTKKQVASLLGQKKDKPARKGRPSKYPNVADMHFYDAKRSQAKIVSALENAGVITAKQLAKHTKIELLALRGIGGKGVQRIEEVLTEVGLKLKK